MEEITLSPWHLWANAIGWTLIGIAFVKAYVYKRGKKFDFWYWISDNLQDVITGILLTLISVKLGEVIFQILAKVVGIDFTGVLETIREYNLDPIQISLILAIAFQIWLEKRKNNVDAKSETVDPTKPGGPKT